MSNMPTFLPIHCQRGQPSLQHGMQRYELVLHMVMQFVERSDRHIHYLPAFSHKARRNSTMASVSRLQYASNDSLMVSLLTQSVSLNTIW